MKFYTDTDQTVRVRWFFVDEETPFIPYPNAFMSSNWDADPKGTEALGEQWQMGKTWVDGSAPALFPADHFCGTAEQWASGDRAPLVPTPVTPAGPLACCLPEMNVGLLWWFRPEEIAALGEGDDVALWPAALAGLPDALAVGLACPIKLDGAARFGFRGGSFFPPVAPTAAAMTLAVPSQRSDLTTILVADFADTLLEAEMSLGDFSTGPGLPRLLTGSQHFAASGVDFGTGTGTPRDAPHIWVCRRKDDRMSLYVDGVFAAGGSGVDDGLWGASVLQLKPQALGAPGQNGTVQVFEWMGWGRALSCEELDAVLYRLGKTYGVAVSDPCIGETFTLAGRIGEGSAPAATFHYAYAVNGQVGEGSAPAAGFSTFTPATFSIGLNFRATAGFVTDGTNEARVLGETYPHTYTAADGTTVVAGWNGAAETRDRSAAVDRRLAGFNSPNSGTTKFRIDLPSTGNYEIRCALGDATSNTSGINYVLMDFPAGLVAVLSGAPTAGNFIDASNVVRSAANWPALNAAITHTFVNLEFDFQKNNAPGVRDELAHVRVKKN